MNGILADLSPSTSAALQPHLRTVTLTDVINTKAANSAHVDFVTSGALAITDAVGNALAIAMVGREGLTGLAAVLGKEPTPFGQLVLVAGQALRIEAGALESILPGAPDLRDAIGHYAIVRSQQLAQTIHAAAKHTIEERVAAWLLSLYDRIDEDEIAITHEQIASLLGVRRPGVTNSIHILEGEHLIRSCRMRLTVIDRAGLEARAGNAYALPGRRYEALFPNHQLTRAMCSYSPSQ